MQTLAELLSATVNDCSINSSISVVTPRQVAAASLRSELVKSKGVVFSPGFFSISAFVQTLCKSFKDAPVKVSDAVLRHIIRSLTSKRKDKTASQLASVLSGKRGHDALLQTFSEVLEHSLPLSSLRFPEEPVLTEIVSLINELHGFCTSKKTGNLPLLMEFLSSRLEAGNQPEALPERVVFCGFNTITPLQNRLLKALAPHTSLEILMPLPRQQEQLFRENARLHEQQDGLDIKLYQPGSREETPLSEIRQHLFSGEPATQHGNDQLSFFSTPSRFDEAEHAAIKAQELILAGVAPSSICITMRNITDYDQFLRTAMAKFHVPFTLRRGIPMLQSPLVKTLVKMLSAGGRPIRFDELISISCSAFANLPARQELLEAIRESNVYEAWLPAWPGKLSARLEKNQTLREEFEAFIETLDDLQAADTPLASVRGFIRRWITIPESLDSANTDLQAIGKLIESVENELHQVASLIGPEYHPEQVQALLEAIAESSIQPLTGNSGGVHIANFFDAGYLNVDHVLFLGMDEGSVPRSGGDSGGLLTDRLREVINQSMGDEKSLQLSSEKWAAEAQAFYLALSSSRKTAAFYFCSHDEGAREQLPSPYLEELIQLAGIDTGAIKALPGGDQRPLTETPPDIYSMERQLLRRSNTGSYMQDGLASALSEEFERGEHASARFRQALLCAGVEKRRFDFLVRRDSANRLPADEYSGRISEAALLEQIGKKFSADDFQWSHSRIEEALRSPFAFFIDSILAAKQFSLPTREPDHLSLGDLAHKVLAGTIEKSKSSYPGPTLDTLINNFQQIWNSELNNLYQTSSIKELPDALAISLEQLARQIKEVLSLEVADEQERKPLHTEMPFDGSKAWLELDGSRMLFKGRLDRVDEVENGTRLEIIDYKFGAESKYKPAACKLEEGKNIQMPLYMLLAQRWFAKPLEALRGRFISLKKHDGSAFFDTTFKYHKKTQPRIDSVLAPEPENNMLIQAIFAARDTILAGVFETVGTFYDPEKMVARWFEVLPAGEENE